MDSPKSKISLGCNKKSIQIESGSDSDKTYYNGPPLMTAAKEIVANIAISNDISYQDHLLRFTTNTNVECTSSIDTQIVQKQWSEPRSSRQENQASSFGLGRRLSWKDPIASFSQRSSERLRKESPRENIKDTHLIKLKTWLFKTDSRLTMSLLSGGQPLSCDEAESVLKKTKQCLQQFAELKQGTEDLMQEAQFVAEKIIRRVTMKIRDQHCYDNSAQCPNRSSLEKSSRNTKDSVVESFVHQTNINEPIATQYTFEDDKKTQKQTKAKRFTPSQNRFEIKTNRKRKQPRLDYDSDYLPPQRIMKQIKIQPRNKTRRTLAASQVSFSETSLRSQGNVKLQELRESAASPSLLEMQGTMQLTERGNEWETRSKMQNLIVTGTDIENPVRNLSFERTSDMFQGCYDSVVVNGGKSDDEFGARERKFESVSSEIPGETRKIGDFEIATKSTTDTNDEVMVLTRVAGETVEIGEEIEGNSESLAYDSGNGADRKMKAESTSSANFVREDFSSEIIEDTSPVELESFKKLGKKVKSFQKKRADSPLPIVGENVTSLPFPIVTEDISTTDSSFRKNAFEETLFKDRKCSALIVRKPTSKVESKQKSIPNADQIEESGDFIDYFTTAKDIKNTLQKTAELVSPKSCEDFVSFEVKEDAEPSKPFAISCRHILTGKNVSIESDRELETDRSTFQKRSEDLKVLPIAERLDDDRWHLLETYYKIQKKMRENAVIKQTNDRPFTQTLAENIGTFGQNTTAIEHSRSLSLFQDVSGPNLDFSAKKTSSKAVGNSMTVIDDNLLKLRPTYKDTLENCSTISNSDNTFPDVLTVNAKREQTLTQLLTEDSQVLTDTQLVAKLVALSAIKSTNRVNCDSDSISQANNTRSYNNFAKPAINYVESDLLTQSMLKDSQELIGTQLGKELNEQDKKKQENCNKSHPDSVKLAKNCMRSVNDDRSVTQSMLEDGQEIPLFAEKIKKAPFTNLGTIPKVSAPRLKRKSLESAESSVRINSAALDIFELKSKSPRAAEKFNFRGKNLESQECDKSELLQKELDCFVSEIINEGRFGLENIAVQGTKDSLQAFDKDVKSEAFGKAFLPNFSPSKVDFGKTKNLRTQSELAFIWPQNPKKQEKEQFFKNSFAETKKLSAEIPSLNSKRNFVSCLDQIAERSQTMLRDSRQTPSKESDQRKELVSHKLLSNNANQSKKESVKTSQKKKSIPKNLQIDIEFRPELDKITRHDLSNVSQTMSRLEDLIPVSSINFSENESTLKNPLPKNQFNIQSVPGLTAIDVELRQVQSTKTSPNHNLEMEQRNKAENVCEKQAATKRYQYFARTPTEENAARKLQPHGNAVGDWPGFEGMASWQGFESFNSLSNRFQRTEDAKNSRNVEQSEIRWQNFTSRPISANLNEFRMKNVFLDQIRGPKIGLTETKNKELTQSLPAQDDFQVGQQFSSGKNHSQAQSDSTDSIKSTINQDVLKAKQAKCSETFDSLIVKMLDYKNVANCRASESQDSVCAEILTKQTQLQQNIDKTSVAKITVSFLPEPLFPTNLEPARAAERNAILSPKYVRTQSAQDFAPRDEEIADFSQKPFTWENIPDEILKDLEDSSEEDNA